MRTILVCEIATAHGGDVSLAADMIRAAADAGADLAKLQSYSLSRLNPADPQREWLIQAHLDQAAHETLLKVGQDCGIEVFSTPFDVESLQMLRDLGLKRFKVASSESAGEWWTMREHEQWVVSWPWGEKGPRRSGVLTAGEAWAWPLLTTTHLTAIPLYPTPLECVGRVTLLDGLSDHCEGIAACQYAIAQGAQMVEAHLTIPGARQKPWDKTPSQFRALRQCAEDCETMRSGVGQTFRERWTRA